MNGLCSGKEKALSQLTKLIRHVLSVYRLPKNVTCTVDVDALSLL